MNHYVPDVDVGSSDLIDPHSVYPHLGRGEAVAASLDPFYYKGQENLKKQAAGTCVPGNQGTWMEAEPHETHAQLLESGRESALAIDVPLSNSPFHDDEMLSWLQYPSDDTFCKNYCSEQLCELSPTLYPAQGFYRRPISPEENLSSVISSSSQLLKPFDPSMEVRTVVPDTAMAFGAQRAAGLLSQAGADVFSRVHVSRKSSHDASSVQGSDNVHTSLNLVDNQQGKQIAKNFSFFSQHVAAMRSNLQVLGMLSGPSGKERLKQTLHTESGEKTASVEQSVGTASCIHGRSDLSTEQGKEGDAEQGKEVMQGADNAVRKRVIECIQCNDEEGEASVETHVWSAVVGSDILETGNVTLTSLSDGSEHSTEKISKGMLDFSCKRRRSSEEFECDSKDAREALATQEKGLGPTNVTAAKRTRAAETHNQSERRRRDRINAKMRALQELIPNANKTDKASMLDEAIEYVKMLQAQLQIMSVRTGVPIPAMMMPPGMQYRSVQQSPGSSHATTTGNGAGTSRLVMDAASSYVRTFHTPGFLGQHLPNQDRASHWYQPGGAPIVTHGLKTSVSLTSGHAASGFQQLQSWQPRKAVKTFKSSSKKQADSGRQRQG